MTCDESRRQLVMIEGEANVDEAVRVHLASCSECRRFASEDERLRHLVRNLADGEHAPRHLREQVQGMLALQSKNTRVPERRFRLWAASVALAICVFAAAYGLKLHFANRAAMPDRYAQEFMRDHLHYLPGREEIVSESSRQVEQWFQGRVDFPVHVPDVPGTRLEDARVCAILSGRAALVHYRRKPDETLVSLFIAEAPKASETQQSWKTFSASYAGLNSTLWAHRGLVYSVVGSLDDASLRQIAESVQQQEP